MELRSFTRKRNQASHGRTGQRNPPVNIEDELRQSYLDYAMSVIVGRALPMHVTA